MKTFIEKFKIATWNVRTMLDLQSYNSIRRTGLIAKELKRLDIDVVALTETRKENAGSLREDVTHFSGKVTIDEDSALSRNAGVDFAISNSLLESFLTVRMV
eukprot:CAMPEP_0184482774 /NCGR_PEP_ID=MMETSP0113_2-20130426/4357_1 /TAXON_ID=91329 /ORGANISM="Norrisiella sphaerica, Strain BC52" /LENGTH=101 /DNA_ID=CAMNT_0026862725 /DNA_START=448 /DNA_END=753 /DNA_ORIENTATION=-